MLYYLTLLMPTCVRRQVIPENRIHLTYCPVALNSPGDRHNLQYDPWYQRCLLINGERMWRRRQILPHTKLNKFTVRGGRKIIRTWSSGGLLTWQAHCTQEFKAAVTCAQACTKPNSNLDIKVLMKSYS